MLDMSMGSIERGKRRMLKRERATKALSAVRRSSGLLRFTSAYVANVARATYAGKQTLLTMMCIILKLISEMVTLFRITMTQ